MKKLGLVYIYFTVILLFFSCSNLSNSQSSQSSESSTNTNSNQTNYDPDEIHSLNNALDTLVQQFNKVLYRSYNEVKAGIIGSFTYEVKYGNGYSSGSYSYSYRYYFSNDGKYRVSYSQSTGTGSGSNGYSLPSESGTFSLASKNGFYYISLNSSKGTVTIYRYLLSENFLVFLDPTDTTEYKLDLDEATYKYNAEDNELYELEHYSRESGYDGILGKWTYHIGESWEDSGTDKFGNYYSNRYWPVTYQIEFLNDGLFTFTKTEISNENGFKRKENIIQGVFGVIETAENDFQLGLVSYSENKLLTHIKVSKRYLYSEKNIADIISSFKVTYESEFGSIPNSITVEENTILSAEQLPTLSCNGYKFLGWYLNDVRISADKYSVTENILLKAKWEQVGYLVSFETNTTQKVSSQVLSYLYKDEMPIVSRDGYTFEGWYLNSSCTNAIQYPFKIQQDVTIYANWLKNFEVSFETNSENYLPPIITAKIETMPIISKNGYIFAGWYLNSDFSQIIQFPLQITSDTKLYANWKSESEALLITSEKISNVTPQNFIQPMIIFLKGEFTFNDIWNLCYKMKDSSYTVNINFYFSEGITAIEYYNNKKYYVIRSKDWTGTFKEKYLENVTISWYEIIQK